MHNPIRQLSHWRPVAFLASCLLVMLLSPTAPLTLHKEESPQASKPPSDHNSLRVTRQTLESQKWNIQVAYPQLVDSENPVKFTAVNDIIRKAAMREVRSIEDSMPEPADERPGDFYYGEGSFKVVLLAEDLVSIAYLIDVSTGGVHPNHYITGITCQIDPAKQIALSDIFEKPVDYGMLATLCGADLYRQGYGDYGLFDDHGVSAEVDNFSQFVVTKEGLTFFFGEGLIVAYVYGRPRVTLPWSLIDGEGMLNRQCPVSSLAAEAPFQESASLEHLSEEDCTYSDQSDTDSTEQSGQVYYEQGAVFNFIKAAGLILCILLKMKPLHSCTALRNSRPSN